MGKAAASDFLPPEIPLPVDNAVAGNPHILGVFRINARLIPHACDALKFQRNEGERVLALQKAQRRAVLNLQRDAAGQTDGACGILSRRHRQHAAALSLQRRDSGLKGERPIRSLFGKRAIVLNVHRCTSPYFA